MILKKKCKYIFKEVLFNSSDHIITNVVLCMLVCLGGRKGKKDVHAKQLTYLKKGGGGFDTKQTSFKQKQQYLLENQQTLMQNKQSQMQNQPSCTD